MAPTLRLSPERLRAARKAAGITQERAAREVGVIERSIRNIEKGRHRPAGDTVARLAALYRVPMESLFVHAPEGDTPSVEGGANHGNGPANRKPAAADAGERLTATTGRHKEP